MSHRIWSGLTTATFLVTTLGIAPSGLASQPGDADEVPPGNVSQPGDNLNPSASNLAPVGSPTVETSNPDVASAFTLPDAAQGELEVSKVGEYQSQEAAEEAEENLVTIYPHQMEGRQAATLRVRSIPIFTFLGQVAPSEPTVSAAESGVVQASSGATDSDVKLPTPAEDASTKSSATQSDGGSTQAAVEAASESDPVQRASAIAAQINQLHRDGVDAETITVRWDESRQSYVIQAGEQTLLEMNNNTVLPDTTRNPAEDALQATNRLRRLLGGAPPLREIAGRPRSAPDAVISLGPVRLNLSGLASWYGPGFHGARSASGEVFNQNELTAAHRTLPFGTQVRVVNMNNGRSVIVRINDRGPYSRGRVIDLSAAAARTIGMMGSGVAPVRLEVLGGTQTAQR